jgi:hypothetical protein
MTRDDVIRMAREAGGGLESDYANISALKRFAELVAAAERDKHDTGTHTCSNRCQRYACVAVREAVKAEREACAKVCEDIATETYGMTKLREYGECADAIRARGDT